jgi:hypothetical protein
MKVEQGPRKAELELRYRQINELRDAQEKLIEALEEAIEVIDPSYYPKTRDGIMAVLAELKGE